MSLYHLSVTLHVLAALLWLARGNAVLGIIVVVAAVYRARGG